MTSADVRAHLLAALEADLIGPFGVGAPDVTLAQAHQIGSEAAGRDEGPAILGKARVRFQTSGAFEPLLRGVCGDVEQKHRYTRVAKVRSDLRAHGARAQHAHRPDMHLS